jgi:hypothetical protein
MWVTILGVATAASVCFSLASFTIEMNKELGILKSHQTYEQTREVHQPRLPDLLGLSNATKSYAQKS